MTKLIKNDQPTAFVRIIGVLLMVFGMFLVYTATAKTQTATGSAFVAIALGIMIPAQVNTSFAIVVGVLRSLGLVKRAPVTEEPAGDSGKRTSKPKLGTTVSIPASEIEKEAEL